MAALEMAREIEIEIENEITSYYRSIATHP